MSIQELSIANNQKKKLLNAVKDKAVLFQDDNGDLVLNVANYKEFKGELRVIRATKKNFEVEPVETILGDDELDFAAEYIVFS